MPVEYYYMNDLNKLYNAAVRFSSEYGEFETEMQEALDNLEKHVQSLEHWRDTALQLSKYHGEAEADADRIAEEYKKTLEEIGGVWWENPEERSCALILHEQRKRNEP